MDAALAWTIVGSTAGVVAVGTSVVFGILQVRQDRARRPADTAQKKSDPAAGVASAVSVESAITTRPAVTRLPPPVGLLPFPVRGRHKLIEILVGLAAVPDGRVHVLAGLGGSGKTTIALEVARLHQEAGGLVWWVRASDAAALRQGLLSMAQDLGVTNAEIQEALTDGINLADVVRPRLEEIHGWLLVLDSANDPDAFSMRDRLWPPESGLLLVTSRDGSEGRWGSLSTLHRVGPLEDNAGGKVLLDLAPNAGKASEAAKLAHQLGGMPLALHIAGRYLDSIYATWHTFADYRQELVNEPKILLGDSEGNLGGPGSLARIFQVSLERLTGQGFGQARDILCVLSCFEPSVPLPPTLLNSAILDSSFGGHDQVEAGLSGLSSVGLIDGYEPGEDADRSAVTTHPLVAETIRLQTGDALARVMNWRSFCSPPKLIASTATARAVRPNG